MRKPLVFLFDEPLSNLDAELRVSMRIEIARLHRELGNTMIYVTHDQTEAMTLADRIVVLRDGRIEQVGTPRELYEDPDNLFVAGFIGSPRMNILDARRAGDGMLEVGGSRLAAPFDLGEDANAAIKVGFRPEAVDVRRAGSEPGVGSEPSVAAAGRASGPGSTSWSISAATASSTPSRRPGRRSSSSRRAAATCSPTTRSTAGSIPRGSTSSTRTGGGSGEIGAGRPDAAELDTPVVAGPTRFYLQLD